MFNKIVLLAVVIFFLALQISRKIRERAFFSLDDTQKLDLLNGFESYRRYRPLVWGLVLVAFVILACSSKLWPLAFPVLGVLALIYCLYSFWQISRTFKQLSVPSAYRKAFYQSQSVLFAGIMLCALIIGFGPIISDHFQIDDCLDGGGRWNYEREICENTSVPVPQGK